MNPLRFRGVYELDWSFSLNKQLGFQALDAQDQANLKRDMRNELVELYRDQNPGIRAVHGVSFLLKNDEAGPQGDWFQSTGKTLTDADFRAALPTHPPSLNVYKALKPKEPVPQGWDAAAQESQRNDETEITSLVFEKLLPTLPPKYGAALDTLTNHQLSTGNSVEQETAKTVVAILLCESAMSITSLLENVTEGLRFQKLELTPHGDVWVDGKLLEVEDASDSNKKHPINRQALVNSVAFMNNHIQGLPADKLLDWLLAALRQNAHTFELLLDQAPTYHAVLQEDGNLQLIKTRQDPK